MAPVGFEEFVSESERKSAIHVEDEMLRLRVAGTIGAVFSNESGDMGRCC